MFGLRDTTSPADQLAPRKERSPGHGWQAWSFLTEVRAGQPAADIDHESDQVQQGHLVDALALRGDEGRGTLR